MFPFASAGGRPPGFYQIDRSLRFNDDDSAYLSRTPGSASNRKTWTWSGWVKRGNLALANNASLFTAGSSGTEFAAIAFFATTDEMFVGQVSGGVDAWRIRTNAKYRDPSAWYHVVVAVDTTQATSTNRVKIWVNGVQETSLLETSYPTLNYDSHWNNNIAHAIGRTAGLNTRYHDGYMAEVHFVDGTALTPTSFGEFDTNGVWRPIQVSGLTYGTNGFYLSFADNTSTTTLGDDLSGNGNDWTTNNFSVTAGAGNDSLVDTPTNYGTDTGAGGEVRGNYATLNPLDRNSNVTLSNGNLYFSVGATPYAARATFGMTSGKWYWEVQNPSSAMVGIMTSFGGLASYVGADANGWGYYFSNGNKYNNGASAAYGNSYTNTDTIGVAFDADNGKLYFSKNGTWQASGDPVAGTNAAYTGLTSGPYFAALGNGSQTSDINFGQRPFAYTQPTGFRAISTANLPTPDIADPGSYMNVVTYTGTGSSLAVTGVGFQPDLVWIKGRSGATDHALYDSTRGVQNQLESNTTTDETTETTGLTAFGADGFTVGALAQVNTNAATYVGWCWREGVTPGFDVVTYTGTGVARTISHNLGTVPKLIIVKARSTASTDQGWPVYHASNTAAPETDYLLLNSTAATADLDTIWNDTAPTTTVFSVGTNALVNALNDTYVAYLFAEVDEFSKLGGYTGNGSADGVFVYTGHRPRYILIKRSTVSTGSWIILDSKREGYNVDNDPLYAEATTVEGTTDLVDILSNGFKIRSTDASVNTSGSAYVFASFAEMPFSAPANAR